MCGDQNACLWFQRIYFSKNTDCTGRCECRYCNAEFVIVLGVFFIFTSIIECYKKVLLCTHTILLISLTLPLTAQEGTWGKCTDYIRMWVTPQESEKGVSPFCPSPTEASSFGQVTVWPVFLQHTSYPKLLPGKNFLRRLRTFREK